MKADDKDFTKKAATKFFNHSYVFDNMNDSIIDPPDNHDAL